MLFHPNLSGPYDTAYFEHAVAGLRDVAWPDNAAGAVPAPAGVPPARPISFGAFAWGHQGSRGALLADWTADDLLSPAMARTVQLMQAVTLEDDSEGPQIVDDRPDHDLMAANSAAPIYEPLLTSSS